MGMILFGVNPVFQIAKKTAPMIAAALIGALVGVILFFLLPWGADASNLALAQCGVYVVALLATLALAAREKPIWPRLRDLAAAGAATLGMAAALTPMQSMTPGLATLFAQVCVGASIYGALTFAFDTAGLRGELIAWAKRRRLPV
jgi:Polysaccharide biosynthesis C-terminal domain